MSGTFIVVAAGLYSITFTMIKLLINKVHFQAQQQNKNPHDGSLMTIAKKVKRIVSDEPEQDIQEERSLPIHLKRQAVVTAMGTAKQ